ncbi:hypothetical protein F383_13694 [Gossypium arboreum]|uniref:Uncharacterized protein n=1 Tax=Gossypium arboreum TaxID=29729 RepID=A0A0B0PVV6_GOSAR|nr:hypothetical protein F383_13694 [Gossypium arboreum]
MSTSATCSSKAFVLESIAMESVFLTFQEKLSNL